MKVRIRVRPTGYINGHAWPQVGESIDLPEVVAQSMGDWVEPAPETVETRPSKSKVEKRVSPRAQ